MQSIIAQYKQQLEALLVSQSYPFDDNLRQALPIQGGVYRIFEQDADWHQSVYVGKSSSLRGRIDGFHWKGRRDTSALRASLIDGGSCADEAAVTQYLAERCLVQFVVMANARERTWFEHFALAVLRPVHNS